MNLSRQHKLKQSGVGLIELMVSITIGLLIMAGVVQLYINSVQSQRNQEGLSRIQENMRYLTSTFTVESGVSGYMGCIPRYEGTESRITNLLTKNVGVSGGAPELYNLKASSVVGSDNNGLNGTDKVAFKFVTPRSIPLQQATLAMLDGKADFNVLGSNSFIYDSIKKNQIAVITDCSSAHVFMVTGKGSGSTSGSKKIKFASGKVAQAEPNKGQSNKIDDEATIYKGLASRDADGSTTARLYVSSFGVYEYSIGLSARGQADGGQCDVDNPHFCALFKNKEELVEGVIDFQIEYGWRGANGVSFGGANDVSLWEKVDRVKFEVTLSAIEATENSNNANSKRVSRKYSQVVKLRNPIVKG